MLPSKRQIAARFGRRAALYESGAGVQAEILGRVAALMRGAVDTGEIWCDAGSGGGMLAERLAPLPEGARVVCVDLAIEPLRRAVELGRTGLAVNGDIDTIPFKCDTFDGVAAVSMLQWVSSPLDALGNIARMLKAGGKFYFSVFTDGAFAEIVELRRRLGLGAAVWLPEVGEFLGMLEREGFEVSSNNIERFDRMLMFDDAGAALRSLSDIGATAVGGRMLGRSEVEKLRKEYGEMFSGGDGDGRVWVSLTYRAVVGWAVKK